MTTNSYKFDFIFEYPILTKALGPLDYSILKIIQGELKTNVACVYSDLGGGVNGHLGLISTLVQYNKVAPGTPYVRHVMPLPPVFPNNTPQHEVTQRCDNFKEEKRLFKEMTALEKSLLKQLSQALLVMYLKGFQNKHSNAIKKPIADIITHLFDNYGRVPEENLLEEDSTLRAKVFDLTEPLILMFHEIEDLQDLANAADLPYTDQEILNLGLTLIKNTNDFKKGITDCIEKTTGKTWENFKIHFPLAQENLQKVRGPTMKSSILSRQVNAITAELQKKMMEDRISMLFLQLEIVLSTILIILHQR